MRPKLKRIGRGSGNREKGEVARRRERAVRAVEREIEDIGAAEAGVAVDLMLSYRAVEAWKEMIDVVKRMAPPLAETALVQEQLGFALNRDEKGEEADGCSEAPGRKRGPSSETYGILAESTKIDGERAVKRERSPAVGACSTRRSTPISRDSSRLSATRTRASTRSPLWR